MPNDDYIKRSELIEHFRNYNPNWGVIDKDTVLDDIRDFPAADVEPKQRWIPVTERLPDAEYGESQSVLVVTKCGIIYMLYFDGGNWCYPSGETYENREEGKVTHWMSLPSTEGINET